MRKRFFVLVPLWSLLFLSCDEALPPAGSTGEPQEGIITFYTSYDTDSVAYYTPELESGWYKCAVSENKLSEFPPQSAAEITYNGTAIRVLVTDLCPNEGNALWTSKPNYFFDVGENAFAVLDDTARGYLNVSIKKIAYQTSRNIHFAVKDGSNQWWLAGRFYNMRYPITKVEVAFGNKAFMDMQRLDGYKNNWWVVKSSNGMLLSDVSFRLTDVSGHTVTGTAIRTLSVGGSYDIGVNFPY